MNWSGRMHDCDHRTRPPGADRRRRCHDGRATAHHAAAGAVAADDVVAGRPAVTSASLPLDDALQRLTSPPTPTRFAISATPTVHSTNLGPEIVYTVR